MMPVMTSSLGQVLATLHLEQVDERFYAGTQLDAPANHILGGHISAQALIAAGRSAPGRTPHSLHSYFLRPGDASRDVEFEVTPLQEGRRFSARRVTARQDGEVLLESMASFQVPAPDDEQVEFQPPMPAVPEPDSLPVAPAHFANTAEASGAPDVWASLRWYERRTIDSARLPPARTRIWWRPDVRDSDGIPGELTEQPLLTRALVAYLSAVSLTEPAFATRPTFTPGVQRDHSVWFHAAPVLTDWLLYDQTAPSSAVGRTLAAGSMYNRNGDLVCTTKQEMYFPPAR